MADFPLFVVTRLQSESQSLCQALSSVGLPCLPLPLFDIVPIRPTLSIDSSSYDYGIFLSRTAVSCAVTFWQHQYPAVSCWLSSGSGTTQCLLAHHFPADRIFFDAPGAAGSDRIRAHLDGDPLLSQKRVLLVRGTPSRVDFLEWLLARARVVDDFVCYQRVLRSSWIQDFCTALGSHREIVWIVTSTETAHVICSALAESLLPLGFSSSFFCGHPRIAEAVSSYGSWPVTITKMMQDSVFQAIKTQFLGENT